MRNKHELSQGLFTKLVDKANNAANVKITKSIKKRLVVLGSFTLATGLFMIVAGLTFFLITTLSANNVFKIPDITVVIISLILFFIGSAAAGLGSIAIKSGLSIIITEITIDSVDQNNNFCPNCKDKIDLYEFYCNKCGINLRPGKTCKCGTLNEIDDKFCRKCGKKLK